MKCSFEIENLNLDKLSFEEIQKTICKKIASVIIHNEERIYTLEALNK